MAKLPERKRNAAAMRHLDGMSKPAIAEIMDLNIEATESLILRGKRKLSNILKSYESELGYSNV